MPLFPESCNICWGSSSRWWTRLPDWCFFIEVWPHHSAPPAVANWLRCIATERRSKLTSSLLSLYTSAYMEQHCRTLLMNSACRRISAHDVAFIQRHHHHWSSAVCICQPLVTELYLLLPHMWNSLLQHVTSASSLPAFHRRLKTHLFERYFHWLLVSCLSSDFVIIHINRSCYLLDLHISK